MNRLYLEDLSNLDEAGVKKHISEEYAGDKSGFDYGNPSDMDKETLLMELGKYDVLVAYESVGSWGCDSSSWFLMRNKETGEFVEFSGSHCSCYGFEGQYSPDVVSIEYLASERFYFPAGGYDENADNNKRLVSEFLQALKGEQQ